jgi:FkbM family methyltransferase
MPLPLPQQLRQRLGLARSIAMYYGNPLKLARMKRFYSEFIRPGDLCFDIGAHVGNRLWTWAALGARVVAVEPQPLCMKLLRRWYGRHPQVTLVEEALGAEAGYQSLWISERTPTVTTLSPDWIEAVKEAPSFAGVKWERNIAVKVTTLDNLIARYGEPVFCKIDVEGYELEVLRGLLTPLSVLSFEYVPAAKEMALGCLAHLQQLGNYEFNWSVGEQHRWQAPQWQPADAIAAFIDQLSSTDNSGDIYARRKK